MVVASDWCWSISCFSRRPHKKGRRQEGLRWPSRKTPRSATLPKPPPASGGAPPAFFRVRKLISEPVCRRTASREDYFTACTEVVAWWPRAT